MGLKCIYCEDSINSSSVEHIIQSALGSNLKSRNLLCAECNNYFSHKDSGNIDSCLVDQFKLFRNLFSIWGDRRTPPPVLRNVGKIDGMTIHFGPGGTPIFAKSVREESIDENGQLIISVSSPSIEKAKEQYEHIKRQFKEDGVKLSSSKKYKSYCNELLNFQLTFGGEQSLKGVLKNLYSFLFYLKRDKGIGIPVSVADLDQDRKYIRYNEKHEDVYASIDYKNPMPIKLDENDLSNYIFIFGSDELGIIFGYFIVFGHIQHSAVLKEGYSGKSFGYGIKHSPFDKSKEIIKDIDVPKFDASITKNYPLHANDYFPIAQKKFSQLLQLYFEESSKTVIEDIVDISFSEGLPKEGEEILPEHNRNVSQSITEEFAKFYFKIPSEENIDLDE